MSKEKTVLPTFVKGEDLYWERFEFVMEKKGAKLNLAMNEPTFELNGSKWRRCYNPDVKSRSELPAYWFIEDTTGTVISTRRKEAITLKMEGSPNGYKHYSMPKQDGKQGTIYVHILLAVVFDVPMYGDAKRLVEEKGLAAFGKDKNSAQIHHKSSVLTKPDLINNTQNLSGLPYDR